MRDWLEGWVLRNSGGALVLACSIFLPHTHRGMRVIAGASHELEPDPVRFGFLFAAVRQLKGDIRHFVGEIDSSLPHTGGDRNTGQRDLLRIGTRHPLTAVFSQRVADLVANHRRQLIVTELELIDEAGVNHYLPARHAISIEFLGREHVYLPLPARRIRSERCRLRNQSLGNVVHALDVARISVELAFLARFLHLSRVSLRRRLVDLLARYQHLLLALDADRARCRCLYGLAASDHSRAGENRDRGSLHCPHAISPSQLLYLFKNPRVSTGSGLALELTASGAGL